MYCTHCQKHFYALATEEDENHDESYSFCPDCKSDMYIVDSNGQKEKVVQNYMPPIKNTSGFNQEEYELKERNRTNEEDKAIAYYLEVYETQGREAATNAFWNTYK